MRRWLAVFTLCSTLLVAMPAGADDPPSPSDDFFISMRAPDLDPAPRFVGVSPNPTDEQTVALESCDAKTYYLTPDDLAAVNAALANDNTVELQRGPDGSAPQDSSVLCLMQASQE